MNEYAIVSRQGSAWKLKFEVLLTSGLISTI